MAVDEEQQRQTAELTETEIKRRVAISESLIAVHKELLSKREATKVSEQGEGWAGEGEGD